MSRQLTQEEQDELDALNDAVESAKKLRREWLDAKMVEVARFKIGDDIYDMTTGEHLGKVFSLYRFQRGRDGDAYDTHLNVDYTYGPESDGYGGYNTSSKIGVSFGTKDDLRRSLEMRARALK